MSFDAVAAGAPPHTISRPSLVPGKETLVGLALLGVALAIGLATASDYGLSVDEFNVDDYGPKALAWYASGFTDRSHFNPESVERYLWYYGPWFHILVALVQSLNLTHPHTVRHAMTFAVGLAGLVALIPIARLTVGRWAGPIAIALCLTTGYFYGSLFYTPIDVPFLAAMMWATLAVLVMARRSVPSWPATIIAGLLTGLAMATRTGGIITHAYLVGLMSLCALQLVVRHGRSAIPALVQIGFRIFVCIVIAWLVAIALWPWLQIGNPLQQFATAYTHFNKLPMAFDFPHWGRTVFTNSLPWHYILGQWLARLPDAFLALLAIAGGLGVAIAIRFVRATVARFHARGVSGLAAPVLAVTRVRGTLLIIVAVVVPVGFLALSHATLYDGVRHELFVIPLLALLAAGALLRIFAYLRESPFLLGVVVLLGAAHAVTAVATLIRLHPLEYAAMNTLAGGTAGAAGRFELDYWSIATAPALRQLERRLDQDTSGRFAADPPRVMVCIGHREWAAGRLFRRNWTLATEFDEADFIIDTERWPCTEGKDAKLIDEVKRDGVVFSRIFANKRAQ